MLPAPDHAHAPHAHSSGHRWLDIVMAVSAVFISVVSLVVSIEHGNTMKEMVDQNERSLAAGTMPILQLSIQRGELNGRGHITVSVKNSGVGPALIDQFEIRYKGVSYSNPDSLLRACCAAALPANENLSGVDSSQVSGAILPARESVVAIGIDKLAPPALVPTLAANQSGFSFHACYCSVLNQCWQTDFHRQRPLPVDSCTATPNAQLW